MTLKEHDDTDWECGPSCRQRCPKWTATDTPRVVRRDTPTKELSREELDKLVEASRG